MKLFLLILTVCSIQPYASHSTARNNKTLKMNFEPGGVFSFECFDSKALFGFIQNLRKKLRSLENLDLRGCDLKDMPVSLPPKFSFNLTKVQAMDFSKNGLTTFPINLLANMSTLTDLNLMGNQINELPPEVFAKCYNLTTLNLSFNQIDILFDNNFRELKKLKILNLSNNVLRVIGYNDFSGLTSLRLLDLSHNELIDIHPGGLRDLGNLQVAQFSFNNLTLEAVRTENSPRESLFDEENDAWLRNLKKLDVSHNKIRKIFRYDKIPNYIKEINFSHNQLPVFEIPRMGFPSMVNRILDLTSNRITTLKFLPQEFTSDPQFARKTKVLLSNNPLSCDCALRSFLRLREVKMLFRQKSSISLEDLTCHTPKILANVSLDDFKSSGSKCFVTQSNKYGADCPAGCECWLRPKDKAYLVDCADRALRIVPNFLKSPKGHFIELNLAGNELTNMPALNSQPGYDAVEVLSLARNRIDNFPAEGLPPRLRHLDLSSNNLTRLNDEVLAVLNNSTQLKYLGLGENPWGCGCEAVGFYHFIQTQVLNITGLENVRCFSSNRLVFKLTPDELCPPFANWVVVVSVTIAAVGLLTGIAASLYHNYQNELRVWLYSHQWCLKHITEDEFDRDKEFDAFISYSHKDETFVVNDLIPELETGPVPFKLCLHYRHFIAGESIAFQIVKSVENSRRTIIVLSPNFLESTWSRMEFRTAHAQALSERRSRVIVIIYDDVGPIDGLDDELRAYLSTNT